MKLGTLVLFMFFVLSLQSCNGRGGGNTSDTIVPLDLENFSIVASGFQNIDVTVDFPSDTSSYTSVKIYRSTVSIPDCGSGTLARTITDFSVDPLVFGDVVDSSAFWYYRACPVSPTNTLAVTLPTASAAGGFCLIAGTQVSIDLQGGTKNIEDLVSGDEVVSFNTETKQLELSQVTMTFRSDTEVSYGDLILENNVTFGVTGGHLIFVNTAQIGFGDYVLARDLNINDELILLDSNQLSLIKVLQPFISDKEAFVYTISVQGNHNFFANGVLVHNGS